MIVLIDNYDSFTYNLLHYLGELGANVSVVRHDACSVEEVLATPNLKGIVISPGPCTPNEAGISLALITKLDKHIPLLGVCLGHEAIGQAFGGTITKVAPMHGKTSLVHHQGKGIFANLPTPFHATRYHSLVIDNASLPECLEVTATSEDGLIMGVQHKTLPIHGVQFHPESIASEQGHALLKNFLELTA